MIENKDGSFCHIWFDNWLPGASSFKVNTQAPPTNSPQFVKDLLTMKGGEALSLGMTIN